MMFSKLQLDANVPSALGQALANALATVIDYAASNYSVRWTHWEVNDESARGGLYTKRFYSAWLERKKDATRG